MNGLILAMAGVVAGTGALLGGVWTEWYGLTAIDLPPGTNCDSEPLEPFAHVGEDHGGAIFLLDNNGQVMSARACLYDGALKKRIDRPEAFNGTETTGMGRMFQVPIDRYVWVIDIHLPDRPHAAQSTQAINLGRCGGNAYAQVDVLERRANEGPLLQEETRCTDVAFADPVGYSPLSADLQEPEETPVPASVGVVGLALGTMAFGAGAVRLPWRDLRFAFLVFFTRLQRPRVLDQPVRGRIVELVAQEPGIHESQIVDRLGLGVGQGSHHLSVLVRERALQRLGLPGFRRYFVHGKYGPHEVRALAMLRVRAADLLYRSVLAQPEAPMTAHAARARLSRGRASHVAKKLVAVGLVERRRVGRTVFLRPTAMLQGARAGPAG